jgi:serine/threonine protein kinase
MTDQQLVLNRYRLQKRIALGGSAEVWHARDQKLNRAVAVKRLHAHLLPDPASRRRLAAEAHAVARLKHPGIVQVYEVDTKGEMPALVMELVDGESLATRLEREGPLPADEAARIAADVADALYHAHRQGLVHRDVKPGNVLIGRDGSTRLVDFGIAHSLAQAAERLTLTGSVIGTPRYMAPEQLTDGPIGPRTDLFGLGLLLYEMLTGRSPYVARAPAALAQEQAAGPPAISGVDPALAAIIRSCLSPNPADRPLHAGAIAAALRAWLEGRPNAALAVAAGEPVPPAPRPAVDTGAITQPMRVISTPEPEPGLPHEPDARPAPRRPRRIPVVLAAAAAAVVLIALAAVALLGPSRPAAAAPSASPSATATAMPTPAWLAGLMQDYQDKCGAEDAQQVAADVAAMSEGEAKDYIEGLIDACDQGKPGKGEGKGKGR